MFEFFKKRRNECKILERNDNFIKFEVNRNLSKPQYIPEKIDTKTIETIISNNYVLASSFRNDFLYFENNAFYECILKAYAQHLPLVLSPDMIWLIICQGFSYYVNNNAEELRYQFVNHSGKRQIEIELDHDIYSDNTDWGKIFELLEKQLSINIKDNLVNNLIADFSTTGTAEKIVSQITIMDIFKEFYNFSLGLMICGIPYIRLMGTTQDWKKIIDKVKILSKYNLQWWVDDLMPILEEFVSASSGKAKKDFWQSIVRKKHFGKLREKACIPLEILAKKKMIDITKLDGWFLKLFPFSANGRTLESVYPDVSMLSEITKTDFVYKQKNGKEIVKEIPMTFFSGFVGISIDDKTNEMCPKIGWMVAEK